MSLLEMALFTGTPWPPADGTRYTLSRHGATPLLDAALRTRQYRRSMPIIISVCAFLTYSPPPTAFLPFIFAFHRYLAAPPPQALSDDYVVS